MSGPLEAANSYRFDSKEWNDNAGLYYFGRRYYDPNLQRFVNRDPLAENGGLNLYGYCGNNPVSLVDILGLCPKWWDDFLAALFGTDEDVNTRQWLPETIGPVPPDPFTYDALVIGNGVSDQSSPMLQGSAEINSIAYNMFFPFRGSGLSDAAVTTFSDSMIVSVEADYVGVEGGMLAARNVALNNLNAAQKMVSQATDLVEGAMQAVNNAGQAGLNSVQMQQANAALISAYRAESYALQRAIIAQREWANINSATVNGVRLLPP